MLATRHDAAATGEFCWLDLAATDANAARRFYRATFGWTARQQSANGGQFTRLQLAERDIGSLYQLSAQCRAQGTPSHWLPYVRVDDADVAAQRAVTHGGLIMVRPFAVAGIARIAVIRDAVGAPLGVWQPLVPSQETGAHG
ncbi:MAG: VOC family protein [Proteobacteria bacterium]|nr:VOC family protein [Pseudomonadota bacterium]